MRAGVADESRGAHFLWGEGKGWVKRAGAGDGVGEGCLLCEGVKAPRWWG